MLRDEISKLRQNYSRSSLLEADAASNPILQFEKWFADAAKAKIFEHNAMTLATSVNNIPNARIVLLKSFDPSGFVFFTNYDSQKGHELDQNPQAALVFLWKDLERQIRIRGVVKRVAPVISEAYFNSRPIDSQCGAVASDQSATIASREALENKYAAVKKQAAAEGAQMPKNWGGYILDPREIEFWQGREGRMHDRLLYTKQGEDWVISRLQP